MERVLLSALGGLSNRKSAIRHPMALEDLDALTSHLQVHAIEKLTASGYVTGARDYVKLCINHNLSLDPTPQTLSRYIAYTSRHIALGPKYLTGHRHFICDFFPDFDKNRAHPLVQATIRGSKKLRIDLIRRKLPLCSHHLAAFVETARQTKDYDNLLFATMMSCSFYACHRLGEVVKKTAKESIDWQKVIK